MTTLLQCGQFEAILPWYVNGTASAEDRALAQAHLQSCASCGERLRSEQALVRHMRDPAGLPPPDSGDSWQRFERTLGESIQADPRAAGSSRILRWAVGAQAAALVVLSVLLAQALWNQKRSAPEFHTVTSTQPAPAAFTLRLAAAPGVSPQSIARIAREHGLRVVGGPSALGVYTVQLDPDALRPQILDRLRSLPELQLVEQVGGR